MGKRKADCTPEEWASHLAKLRAYSARPDVADRRHKRNRKEGRTGDAWADFLSKNRERSRKPEVVAQRRGYNARPDVKARHARYERLRRAAPERRDYDRARLRQQRTGVTPGIFLTLMRIQDGCCAVCRNSFTTERGTHADHCHDTQVARGLLCHRCNAAEGHIKKTGVSPSEWARRLEEYLANPPARIAELV